LHIRIADGWAVAALDHRPPFDFDFDFGVSAKSVANVLRDVNPASTINWYPP